VTAVADFLSELDHPLKPAIVDARKSILVANKAISERIKWNAPSFC